GIPLAPGAHRDPVTALYGTHAFHERLREEVARSLRHGQPVSLLIGDIDDFSALNHDLGDQAGDEVLRRIALIMTEEPNTRLRDSDVAGRFGGDEIAVLLPETGKPGAIVKAQR